MTVAIGDGSGETTGFPDANRKRELHVKEDVSPNQPSGQLDDSARVRTGTAPGGRRFHASPRMPSTTTRNPWTDDSCDAVIVFDRYRTTSLITKELVRTLKLPAASTPTADFSTFTGYHSCVDLLSREGFRLSIESTAYVACADSEERQPYYMSASQ
ncbi:hypothetical protein AAVH_10425 [Aphelenchoides avenae]|nr:hypothetical protein AAVH_10425 [Aphelenchus avenae]